MLWSILLVVLIPQDSFIRFTYCRESARGTFESQCLDVNPDGTGEVKLKRRGLQEVKASFAFSPAGRERMLAVLAATNSLAQAASYESKKKVADLGLKRLTLETPSGRKVAEFNYSDLKEVNALSAFFDAMLNQQTIIFDLDTALRYERLSVPEKLDQIENELRANRIADPQSLAAVLEKVAQDDRVMNYARTHAKELKEKVTSTKR